PNDRYRISRFAWPGAVAAGSAAAVRSAMPLRVPLLLAAGRARALTLHHTLLSPAVVRAARSRGAAVVAWTVNDPVRIAALARLATAYIDGALRRAAVSAPGGDIRLVVSVHGAAVRDVVDRLAQKVEHRAAKGELALTLRAGKPYVAPRAFGRRLDTATVLR